jgi:hypothetical protein
MMIVLELAQLALVQGGAALQAQCWIAQDKEVDARRDAIINRKNYLVEARDEALADEDGALAESVWLVSLAAACLPCCRLSCPSPA